MIVKYESAVAVANQEISTLTQAWEARKCLRQQAEGAEKLELEREEELSKAKCKSKVTDADGESAPPAATSPPHCENNAHTL